MAPESGQTERADPAPTSPARTTASAATEPGGMHASSPPATPPPVESESAVRGIWRMFRREPMLLITASYIFVSIVGLWDSYLYYQRFGLPILQFLQSSDYFVAGLRQPAYFAILLFTLATSILALLPDWWSRRHPERARHLQRRWWGRFLVPKRSDWWMYFGMHPETTTMLVVVVLMGYLLTSIGLERADDVYRGGGDAARVEVQLLRESDPMPGDWRILGTSSAFVFLWEPGTKQAQVVPIETLARISPRRAQPAITAQRPEPPTPQRPPQASEATTASGETGRPPGS
jgi:hypothetical protein